MSQVASGIGAAHEAAVHETGAFDPGLLKLFLGMQGHAVGLAGLAATQTMDLQAKVAVNKWDEVSLVEGAAAKELSKAGSTTDIAGLLGALNAGFNTPQKATA